MVWVVSGAALGSRLRLSPDPGSVPPRYEAQHLSPRTKSSYGFYGARGPEEPLSRRPLWGVGPHHWRSKVACIGVGERWESGEVLPGNRTMKFFQSFPCLAHATEGPECRILLCDVMHSVVFAILLEVCSQSFSTMKTFFLLFIVNCKLTYPDLLCLKGWAGVTCLRKDPKRK